MRRVLALLAATVVGGCAGSRPAPPDASPAFALEAAVERVASAHAGADALWPGYDPLAVPLAVYDGERTVLFRHPSPPEGFVRVPGGAAFVYAGRHEAMRANSSADIGGVPTATVLLGPATPGADASDRAPLAIHEAFHVFQRARHPSWAANEADLFVYPTGDAGLLALRRLETEALARALAAMPAPEAMCWARQALALREARFSRMDSASVAYERGSEMNEGLATYVEGRAAGRPSLVFPADDFAPAGIRLRAYVTGPVLALLLDQAAPGWPARFEADDRQTLDGALAAALGPGEPCAFSAETTSAAEQRAQADVAALAEEQAERLGAFERLAGWRVVVDASESPLWPQGFDPINVDRVGPARVLHARFLTLGNGAGQVEALDTATADVSVLTDGAGPHPLFNGIRRVVVAGLPEAPNVSEETGSVTVRGPGVEAAFQGATVSREGQTVIVRLRP